MIRVSTEGLFFTSSQCDFIIRKEIRSLTVDMACSYGLKGMNHWSVFLGKSFNFPVSYCLFCRILIHGKLMVLENPLERAWFSSVLMLSYEYGSASSLIPQIPHPAFGGIYPRRSICVFMSQRPWEEPFSLRSNMK